MKSQQKVQLSQFFDRLLLPLLNQVRHISESLKKRDLQEVIYDSHLQIESLCLQIVDATVRVVLTGDIPARASFTTHYQKDHLLKLVLQAKDYFKFRQSPSLKNLLKVIPTEEEGFSEDEQRKPPVGKMVSISLFNESKPQQPNDIEDMQRQLKTKEEHIQELTRKVQLREDNLSNMTAIYLKDLQNLREQMQKQSLDGNYEFFEVSYFDSSLILDETTRQLLNQRIGSLKDQYERFAQSMMSKMTQLQSNVQKQVEMPQDYDSLVQRIFILDGDPYRLWKTIQDQKGTSFLIDVLVNQKFQTGINYKEISKAINRAKSQESQQLIFRQELEQQVLMACAEAQSENDSLRQERNYLRIRIQEAELSEEQAYAQIEKEVTQKVEKIAQDIQRQFDQLQDQSLLKIKLQSMNQVLDLEKQQIRIRQQQEQISRMKAIISRLELENQDLLETLQNTKSDISSLKMRLKVLSSNLKIVVNHIDQRMKNIKSMEDINLTKEKNELVRDFVQKMKTFQGINQVAHHLEFTVNINAIFDAHDICKIRKVEHASQTILIAVNDELIFKSEAEEQERQRRAYETGGSPRKYQAPVHKQTQTDNFQFDQYGRQSPLIQNEIQTQTEPIVFNRSLDEGYGEQEEFPKLEIPIEIEHSLYTDMILDAQRIRSRSVQRADYLIATPVIRHKKKSKITESLDSQKWGNYVLNEPTKIHLPQHFNYSVNQTGINLRKHSQSPTTQQPMSLHDEQRELLKTEFIRTARPNFFKGNRKRFHCDRNMQKIIELEDQRQTSQENYRERVKISYERHMKRLVGQQVIDDLVKSNLRSKEYRAYKSQRTERNRLQNFSNVFAPVVSR